MKIDISILRVLLCSSGKEFSLLPCKECFFSHNYETLNDGFRCSTRGGFCSDVGWFLRQKLIDKILEEDEI